MLLVAAAFSFKSIFSPSGQVPAPWIRCPSPIGLASSTLPCSDNLHEIINIGRWVLLGLLCAQVLAIGLASCLRCCSKGRSYEEFQEEEEAEYDARRAAAAEQLDALKAKLGLTAATQGGEGGAPGRSKRVISLTAVSGSAAERQLREQQRQRTMRSSLFDRSEAAEAVEHSRLEADLEAGTISTR